MPKMIEIRWHGRGGQGAKTAALIFADSVLSNGKFAQAFPEYGPERMGAPVQAFNRISDEPITLHCHVDSPQLVVVLDPTLIGKIDVTGGLPAEGIIIVNSSESATAVRAKLKWAGGKVYTVDASRIALETIGRPFPNTPMMGALVRITGMISLENMLVDTRKKMEKKFRDRPEITEGNLKAIEHAFQEVKGE